MQPGAHRPRNSAGWRRVVLPLAAAIFSAGIGASLARRYDPTLRPWPVTTTPFSIPLDAGAFSYDDRSSDINFNFKIAGVRRGDRAGIEYVIPALRVGQEYELRLEVADRYPHDWPGQEELQVLVDGSSVWRRDVGEGRFTGWIPIRTRVVAPSGSLTLRVHVAVIGDPPPEAAWGGAGPFGVRFVKLIGPVRGTAINVSGRFLVRRSHRFAWIAFVAAAAAVMSLLLFRLATRNQRKLARLASISPFSKPKALGTLLPVFVFLWPFIYFLPRVASYRGHFIATGMDFLTMSYPYKLYLLDSLSHLRVPLWSPAEAAGYPFYSSPFTQTFYPFNLPLAVFYRLADGYQILDHQRFTVLGVSIFALGLFFWLRLFSLGTRAALAATLIMSVSFRMAEILRFPNAVHTAAWYPWILLIVTRGIQASSRKSLAKWALLLFPVLVLFITAGYPYYVYYFQFLIVPYLLLLLVPALRRVFRLPDPPMPLRALLFLSLASLAALLLCSPYIYKVYSLLNETVDRGTSSSLDYATAYIFNFEDSIGSLLFPPAAQAEGWYFFGITGLILILVYFASTPAAMSGGGPGEPPEPPPWYLRPAVKILFLAWFALISAITYGRSSPVFLFLWHHLPFFPRLRVWGRLNIVLVPLIAWMLAIAYEHFENSLRRRSSGRLIAPLIALYALVLSTQLLVFTKQNYDPYWPSFFKAAALPEFAFIAFGFVGAALICALLGAGSRGRLKPPSSLTVALALVVLVSVAETAHVGLLMWGFRAPAVARRPLDAARLTRESLMVPRTAEHTTLPNTTAFNVGTIENWYFTRYSDFLQRAKLEPLAAARLLGQRDTQRLYFSGSINHSTVQSFLQDCDRFGQGARVLAYTGDHLSVEINAPTRGYLSFIDNWQADWEASVDRKAVPIETLFGTFKSVRIPAGKHLVTFDYRPKL